MVGTPSALIGATPVHEPRPARPVRPAAETVSTIRPNMSSARREASRSFAMVSPPIASTFYLIILSINRGTSFLWESRPFHP